jgi:dUTP pyrophosphatase
VSTDDDLRKLRRRVSDLERPRGIRIKLLSSTAKAPQYMTAGAAGADVFADFGRIDDARHAFGFSYGGSYRDDASPGRLLRVLMTPGTVKIPLGFAVEIPTGWVGVLKGRSGLASKGHEGHVAYIDSDYRGECCMLLHIASNVHIAHGERVGQVAFMPAPQFELVVVDELSETERNTSGFGSTGK